MKISILLLSYFFVSYTFSNNEILLNKIKNASDKEKLKLYEELIEKNIKTNPEKTKKWVLELSKIANVHNDKNYKAYVFLKLGNIYRQNGQYDSSKYFLNKALSIEVEFNNKDKLSTLYSNMSTVEIETGNFKKAIYLLNKALNLSETTNNLERTARILVNLGDVYSKLGKTNEAIQKLNSAIHLAEKIRNSSLLATTFNTKGIHFTTVNKLDSALFYFEESAKIREKLNEFSELYWNYNNIGGIYYYYKKFDISIYYFEKANEMAIKMGSLPAQCTVLNNIGSLYNELKQHKKAIEYHLKAYYLANKINQSNVKLDALENIMSAYKAANDYKNSLLFFEKFIALKDSLFSIENTKNIEEIETKYKVEKKNVKIASQEKLLQKAKTIKLYLILIIVLILFVAIGFYFVVKNKQKLKLQEVIFQEKQKSLGQIIDAEEKERSRIAKDLHDGIVQELTALKIQLEKAKNDSILVQNTSSDLDLTIKNVREIAYQMMPVTLREYGLIPALQDMFQKSLISRNISVNFDFDEKINRLPEKIEISLFRITQELTNNVIKHSSASEVNILLSVQNKQISFIFEDNGKGFDASNSKNGIGMSSLKSRVELVNGNINFQSQFDEGTIVIIKIPLE